MSQPGGPERDYEKLSKAITEAVMTSGKVRKVVEEIRKKDEICDQSFMVLVLRLSTLTESADSIEPVEDMDTLQEEPPKKKTRKSRKKSDAPQYIDGERLSKKEIDFQEFANKDFDQDEWLKRNGLSF